MYELSYQVSYKVIAEVYYVSILLKYLNLLLSCLDKISDFI